MVWNWWCSCLFQPKELNKVLKMQIMQFCFLLMNSIYGEEKAVSFSKIETINVAITSKMKTNKSYSSRNFRSQTNYTDATFTTNHKCLKKWLWYAIVLNFIFDPNEIRNATHNLIYKMRCTSFWPVLNPNKQKKHKKNGKEGNKMMLFFFFSYKWSWMQMIKEKIK